METPAMLRGSCRACRNDKCQGIRVDGTAVDPTGLKCDPTPLKKTVYRDHPQLVDTPANPVFHLSGGNNGPLFLRQPGEHGAGPYIIGG
jgi:hypothetical protein